MAIISVFYGIIISMYYFDNQKHKLPHIHVSYQDFEVVININDGVVLQGFIPLKQQKLVDIWIVLHREELLNNWNRAVEGMNVYKIDPLQ